MIALRMGSLCKVRYGLSAEAGCGKVAQYPHFSRLNVNLIEAAVRTAADGQGIGRVLSDQIEQEVRDGRLKIILADAEPDPIPVHLITPEGRLESAKVRVFVDFAVALLRR